VSYWRIHPQLPIFAVSDGSTHAAYVPCHVMPVSARLLAELQHIYSDCPADSANVAPPGPAAALVAAAEAANSAWARLGSGLFEPVCLNVQFPYDCDLACSYCYARRTGTPTGSPGSLDRGAILAAAAYVAKRCREKSVPFLLVTQGSGEPAIRWDDLQWCVEATRSAAADAGVPWSGHLSTNGQIDVERAGWIGRTFNHVTVSCDGPPDIQDVVRARRDGTPSSARLAPAIMAIAEGGASIEARVTIMDANARRLPEVVRYLVADLGVSMIRLEPVFGRPEILAGLPDPAELARCCLEACEIGVGLEADVCFASPRLTELHGTYCEAPRQVLRIAPDGRAINCLLGVSTDRAGAVALGHCSPSGGSYSIDQEAVAAVRRAAHLIPQGCVDCINICHCARACPDACPDADVQKSYRCRFQQCLAEASILLAARRASASDQPGALTPEPVAAALRDEVAALPDSIDRDSILGDSLRAARYYTLNTHAMPLPAWSNPDQCIRGDAAQDVLLRESAGRVGAISVYVHLPFCRRKCVFCDCHSVVAGRESAQKYHEYVERLLHDLDIWCLRGGMAGRPVTTVHFGGGTPDAVGYGLLDTLMQAIGSRLSVNPDTEWAIETTSQGSSPECVTQLISLGFRRLHVGVQTLDEGLRRRLSRVSDSKQVLDRLCQAMSRGMVTSVDLLYGLPGQDAASLLADIACLTRIRIHGFSLYRLNLSGQNQGMLRRFPKFRQDPLRECVMLQAAEQSLLKAGYRKNHHVHYALPKDANAYFRHAMRGEDLLAIGASASGSIGPIEYVCARYPEHMKWHSAGLPLEAISQTGPLPAPLCDLFRSLMCGETPAAEHLPATAIPLWNRWIEVGLLAESHGGCRLTALGAWLLAPMLRELTEIPVSGHSG
jgi:coproporphyrinogen III oxidase-like Fe-S oxidoreductase/sulfatase maturation enzyme AslB (radical SAM superfamily)